MITKYGVCYDIKNSPYTYSFMQYEFHFSTINNRNKFEKQLSVKQLWLTDSLSRRFKYSIEAYILAIFQLYHQIEHRGFYIINTNNYREYQSLEDIKFKVVVDDGI